ncbi:LOW QUALITY PROTEIN: FXYD domain-containing ion transport regulator 4-like [Trichechus manatus latirostris]|uniref:FXYD domain-containing ion transport regulator n=1 Tax=Trichechus manatus latirostris TaxID=127582 RepID=A0A2Y9R511_TRIMA|nr:LOW QUALITY PROTEIN: FXYD domain-containing ion transport regulator 4-like [Trichechus manatus latirostris]
MGSAKSPSKAVVLPPGQGCSEHSCTERFSNLPTQLFLPCLIRDMEEVIWGLLLLLASLPALEASDIVHKDTPFYYDWEGLQLGGMICAGLPCIAGIIFVLCSKCKCKSVQKHNPLPEKTTLLIIPDSASNC